MVPDAAPPSLIKNICSGLKNGFGFNKKKRIYSGFYLTKSQVLFLFWAHSDDLTSGNTILMTSYKLFLRNLGLQDCDKIKFWHQVSSFMPETQILIKRMSESITPANTVYIPNLKLQMKLKNGFMKGIRYI